MQLTLAFLSAIIMANMVYNKPASNAQTNMGIDANEFKAEQVSQLE